MPARIKPEDPWIIRWNSTTSFPPIIPDKSYGGDRLYADMIAQARLADRLGYRGVTIPEHHLINILLIPVPLQMAVQGRSGHAQSSRS